MQKEKVGPTRAVRLPEDLEKKINDEMKSKDWTMAKVIRKRLEHSYKTLKHIK